VSRGEGNGKREGEREERAGGWECRWVREWGERDRYRDRDVER